MSKRKPKPKTTYAQRWTEEQAAFTKGGGAMLTPAMLREHFADFDPSREVHGPRSVPANCPRPVVLSIAKAAALLIVDDKSDRFVERFIATGILAADRLSRQRWRFDADELESLRARLAS
ncbi:MAG: hypothetical protein M5U20_11535 [Phycisphaerales bacterium]|nr:hypothetical protein [Phycisphaerales bacterium]